VLEIRSKNWRCEKLVKDVTKGKNISGGIKKVVKLWNRCVEVKGNYIEKFY
jgi:hypothetical protein